MGAARQAACRKRELPLTRRADCKADPALGGTVTVDFTKGANSFFTVAEGTKLTYDETKGAVFTINSVSDAPTISSSKYIFFGKVEVVVQASPGVGIVSSFVLQSDDLDEIDWEWLGGDTANVQTNYFSKGCTDVYDRGGYSKIANPQSGFNTYTIEWTNTTLVWSINGTPVRTLSASAVSGCSGYPQTPMQLKLGNWVAGSPTAPQGTIDWAGGLTNFAQAPFIGYYKSVTVTDYGNGVSGASQYVYGDRSGTFQSIKIVEGNGASSSGSSSSSSAASKAASSTLASSVTKASSATTSSAATTTTTAGSFSNSTTTGGSGTTTSAASITSSASSSQTSAPRSAAGKASSSLAAIAVMGVAVYLGSFVL
jgi:beta-glucanase (GH16 family)